MSFNVSSSDCETDIVTCLAAKRKQMGQKRAVRKQRMEHKRGNVSCYTPKVDPAEYHGKSLKSSKAEEKERAELVVFVQQWNLDPEMILPHVGTEHFLTAVEEAIGRREMAMSTQTQIEQRPEGGGDDAGG